MTAGGMDVSAALAKIVTAISHRSDLYEKWQTEIASDQLHGLQSSAPITIKNALLHAASLGLLDAEVAERLAAELGCAPLANIPDIAEFDPRDDAYWSLPMAMAWIMSLDWKQVARQKSDYRTAHEVWHCNSNVGLPKDGRLNGYIINASWQIRNLRPAAIDRLLIGDSVDTEQSVHSARAMTAREAKRALWRALQEQRLTASGRQDGSRKPIPPFLWQDLLPVQDSREAPEYLREGSHGPRWDEVTVSRDDVMREWPPSADDAPQQQGEPQAENWLRFASLPLAAWLPLEVVLSFVQDGWALHPSNTALSELVVPSGDDGEWRRKGALLAHQPQGTSNYDDPVIDRFNIALTRAGLEERVKFRGVPCGGDATDIRDIPSSYFVEMRVFGPIPVHNPTISDVADGARRRHHWESVTVERLGFLRWLANEYPDIASLHRDYAPVAMPWASDIMRRFISDATERMTVSPGPMAIPAAAAWLAWGGEEPPNDCLEKAMVERLKTTAASLLDRIAVGSLGAFGSKKGRAPELLEARWFRALPVIFDVDGGSTPLSYILGEQGLWFDLPRSALELGRSEPGWPHETTFENVTINSTDIAALAPNKSVKRSAEVAIDDGHGTAGERAVRRALKYLWPDGVPVGMTNKSRNEKINDWARTHSLGRTFSDKTIERALRALR
ncbi:hypothetical protein [Bosea sp. FBZP-16]|uniref:hypothetical protein n=1 Tax=Bosea sp. FBZP-16 TaxID=2065382 RepID=UPI001319D7B8|nr:hypothetical protein [Bosea sp. FBZP-16]